METEKLKATLFRVKCPLKDGWGSATYTVSHTQATDSVKKYGTPHMTNGKIDNYYINVNGNIMIPRDESGTFILVGTWTEHNGYHDFKVSVCQPFLSTQERSIRKLLCSAAFPGIGKKKANAIVDAFGKDTWEVLKNTPEKLNGVKGLSANDVLKIKKAFKDCTITDFVEYLSRYGIVYGSKMRQLYNSFCEWEDPLEEVKRNPYVLLNFKGISFADVDRIGRENGIELTSEQRIVGAILYILSLEFYVRGSVCTTKNRLEKSVLRLLNKEVEEKDMVSSELCEYVLKRAINSGQVSSVNDYIYFNPAYQAETAIVKDVASLVTDKVAVSTAPSDVFSGLPIDNLQKKAVETALGNRICVVTGGAGTGKTTTIKTVIELFKRVYPNNSITLLAPTGKAARRLEEATGEKAMTIHSALRIYDEDNGTSVELPEGLIVIDEASMVDCVLMQTLLSSLKSTRYHLCVVGDKDQLPSVGAGRVFADLISSERIPVVTLTTNHRQNEESHSILENAEWVRMGITGRIFGDKKTNPEDNHFVIKDGLYGLDEAKQIDIITRTYRHAVERFGLANVAVICPLRRKNEYNWLYSVERLNPLLQNIANPLTDETISAKCHGVEFRVNDRVMQTQNTADCSNGDVGVITSIQSVSEEEENGTKTMFSIDFDNGAKVSYSKEDMETVELAYAMTVHKSQGSEYECVLLFLPEEEQKAYPMMFNRPLLYTAITRAKNVAVVFSSKETLKACVENTESDHRVSLLSERLQAMIPVIPSEISSVVSTAPKRAEFIPLFA